MSKDLFTTVDKLIDLAVFVALVTGIPLVFCLEGKRKNYQVCSVQYCVQQL